MAGHKLQIFDSRRVKMTLLFDLIYDRTIRRRTFYLTANRAVVFVAPLIVLALSATSLAVDLTWTGAASNLIYNSGTATGNWTGPTDPPTGVQATGENWIFPDATTLGSGSTTPSFDSGGMLTVGGI